MYIYIYVISLNRSSSSRPQPSISPRYRSTVVPAVPELQPVVMHVLHPDLHTCAAIAAQAPQLSWGDVIRTGLLSAGGPGGNETCWAMGWEGNFRDFTKSFLEVPKNSVVTWKKCLG